jgi:hypothetical protein
MGVAAVPGDGELEIDGMWEAGRQVCALQSEAGLPVAWVTDRAVHSAGLTWARLSESAAFTGLQPVLLPPDHDGEIASPWRGEFDDPQTTGDIEAEDAARLLWRWWRDSSAWYDEDGGDELAAPGTAVPEFPGLAPATSRELDPEMRRRALSQYTRQARIGLVPASRPADVLPSLGWQGAINHRTPAEIAAVLRSWEDRFGARLLEVGFGDIRLLVTRPPQTLEEARQIAAEHAAFSNEAGRTGLRGVSRIAPALVGNPFWDFWWD